MSVNVNISESLANELLTAWEQKVSENEKTIASLKKANEDLYVSITNLRESLSGPAESTESNDSNGLGMVPYHPQWTIFRKVLFLLNKYKKPLSTREIVECIIDEYEPELKEERAKLVSSVSGVLSAKAKEGKLTRGENVLGENIYFMKDIQKSAF